MQIQRSEVDLVVDGKSMRTLAVSPRGDARHPGILLYSEIFQLTPPIVRSIERLAGHGFVVAAPEIYHRIEPPGLVIPYDDAGRIRGSDDARRTSVAEFDRDRIAVLDYLGSHPRVEGGMLGSMGFCIGGHLALRAALDARVSATVACYPTGVHDGKLGRDADARTLAELAQRGGSNVGELLVVFGESDPHVPREGREKIAAAVKDAAVRHRIMSLPCEHTFMRDEGSRYDPAAADAVWVEAIALFRRALGAT
jgi:carboxymethylenebutenolidase